MFGRSLMDELTQAMQAKAEAKKMPAAHSTAAGSSAGPGKPQEPAYPPPAIMRPCPKTKQQKAAAAAEAGPDPWELREKVAEAFHKEMDPMIMVVVLDKLADQAVKSGDAEQVRMLDGCKGPYFYSGFKLNGNPVWKQIEARPGMAGPCMWFQVGQGASDESVGWWCSDAIWVSEKDMNKVSKHSGTAVQRVLWADGDAYSPRRVHFPVWQPEVNRDIVVMPLWDFSCLLIERCAALEADLDSALQVKAHAADEDPEDAGKGKSKGKASGGQHGGWMPKMAQMIAALQTSDWPYTFKLIDRFMDSSSMLRRLVEEKVHRKSLMEEDADNGKGKHGKPKGKGKGKGKGNAHKGIDDEDDDNKDE